MSQATKKILYIEDDPDARFLMADIIRYKGYIYLEAARGLDGIRLARKHRPHLILIDLNLPDMQGYEITTHLKSLDGMKETPIIALTAETKKNIKELVLTAGCNGYITKPINITEFLYKLEEYLAGKKEFVEPEDEKHYLQQYNIQLVERLKKKITELESLNKNLSNLNNELFQSREEMARYNDRLFYMNNLANMLRTQRNPMSMINMLPKKLIEGFHVDRTIVLEINPASEELIPFAYAGLPNTVVEKLQISLSEQFLSKLKSDGGIIWVKDNSEILDESLINFAKSLQTKSFLLGNLYNLGTQKSSSDLIEKVSLESRAARDMQFSRRFLIFIDKGKTNAPFATYEVRMLKSFIQTVGIIYENMVLYSRLIKLYRIKSEQAIKDGLTKLYNYRYFIQELEREANRTKRFRTPFSLLMIDIDFFKEFNDKYGHLEGDKVLRKIAQLFQKNTRTTDTVARYGGEEFAIILPGLGKNDALSIAEKLHVLIQNYKFPVIDENKNIKITISIGVANFPRDSADTKILLDMADQALYKAKKSGRNMVCLV